MECRDGYLQVPFMEGVLYKDSSAVTVTGHGLGAEIL